MLVASGCFCFEWPGEAHYWFASSTGVYNCLWFSFGFAVKIDGVGEQGCCTSGNKMSHYATALRKVEIRLAKTWLRISINIQ